MVMRNGHQPPKNARQRLEEAEKALTSLIGQVMAMDGLLRDKGIYTGEELVNMVERIQKLRQSTQDYRLGEELRRKGLSGGGLDLPGS